MEEGIDRKNRGIRRLCEASGHEVTRLKRVAFGGLDLGDLLAGSWRELTAGEISRASRTRSG